MSNVTTSPDLSSPAFRADPFPTYAELRREAPILAVDGDSETPIPWMRGRVWYTFRYAESVEVLRDTKRFVKDFRNAYTPEEMPEIPQFAMAIADSLIAQDDPNHVRLRRLVNPAFAVRSVERRRPQMEEIVHDLLDGVQDQGQMDLIGDFAFRLPMTVITSLLGLPPTDGDRLRTLLTNTGTPRTPDEIAASKERMTEFLDYLRAAFAERRKAPRDDLMSELLHAQEEGQRLNDEEMLNMVALIVGAGFETTMGMIGNATLNLFRHPEAMGRLRAEPGLIDNAFEELQRYEGSVYTATPRWVGEDLDFHGNKMRHGDRILPVILSANRDEEQFPDADRLDFDRQANRHIGFGVGPHFCLGGPLARLETHVALTALLQRLPNLRLAGEECDVEWLDSDIVHGPAKMMVAWDPA